MLESKQASDLLEQLTGEQSYAKPSAEPCTFLTKISIKTLLSNSHANAVEHYTMAQLAKDRVTADLEEAKAELSKAKQYLD